MPGLAPPGDPSWGWEGRVAPEVVPGRPISSFAVGGNTSLISPEFDVPPDAQTVVVRIGGRVPVVVMARVPGRPDREIGLLEPGGRAGAHVPLAGLEGERVRLVFDPLPALGQKAVIGAVGPVSTRVPGWRLLSGVPDVPRLAGRRALRVESAPVELASDPFSAGSSVRVLRVAIRGSGGVRLQAGRFRRAARATRSWRFVSIPIDAAERSALTLRLRATPGESPIFLRDLGLAASPVQFSRVRVTRRPRLTVVRGRVGPGGAGLRVRMVSGGMEIATDRADRRGRWVIRTRRSGAARLVVDDPDRFHPGRAIRLGA